MKKTIIAIAAVAIFSIGNSFAQRHTPNERGYRYERNDNAREEYEINKLDRIVNLSRKQQNAIKKIENRYDQLAVRNRRPVSMQQKRTWEIQKQHEIMAVLTPKQQQRLLVYERTQKGSPQDNWKRRG
ncbi:MAG TPA: hypothetical protein VGN64_23535 [Dyadobacter sp.]|jgi:hypothetical protein|nr:hypothetical protein [Dyadobacter sp.]